MPAADAPLLPVVGGDLRVPLIDGRTARYVNLDYAASAPALAVVASHVNTVLPLYASVHRGAGYPSQVSTSAYEHARGVIAGFVGARPDDQVIFPRHHTGEKVERVGGVAGENDLVVRACADEPGDDAPGVLIRGRRHLRGVASAAVNARVQRQHRVDVAGDHGERRCGGRIVEVHVPGRTPVDEGDPEVSPDDRQQWSISGWHGGLADGRGRLGGTAVVHDLTLNGPAGCRHPGRPLVRHASR